MCPQVRKALHRRNWKNLVDCDSVGFLYCSYSCDLTEGISWRSVDCVFRSVVPHYSSALPPCRKCHHQTTEYVTLFPHFFNISSISHHITKRLVFFVFLVCQSQPPDPKCQTCRPMNNGVLVFFFSLISTINFVPASSNQNNHREGL